MSSRPHDRDSHTSLIPSTDANTVHVPVIDQSGESIAVLNGRQQEKRRKETILGFILLSIALVACVFQTEVTKVVQSKMSYKKPYFILWAAHSVLITLLPLQLLYERFTFGSLRRYRFRIARAIISLNSAQNGGRNTADGRTDRNWYSLQSGRTPSSVLECWRAMLMLALRLSVLLNAATYSWYVAAGLTSAATLTAIFNTCCCFVYVFSIVLLGESVNCVKVTAVLISVASVAFMSAADRTSDGDVEQLGVDNNSTVVPTARAAANMGHSTHSPLSDSFIGDLFALGSAVFIGLYEVLYTQWAVPKQHHSTHFVITTLGLVGLCTILTSWIPIPILHWVGYETFEAPKPSTFGWLFVIGLLGTLYNSCFTPVLALISPLFASVGIMLTIPLVAITDWFIEGQPVTATMVIGSLGILVGFALLAGSSWRGENADVGTNTIDHHDTLRTAVSDFGKDLDHDNDWDTSWDAWETEAEPMVTGRASTGDLTARSIST